MDTRPLADGLYPIKPELDWVRNKALRAIGALQNRQAAPGLAASATLTAPTAGILACVLMTAKVSGLFLINICGTVTVGAVESAGVTMIAESATPATAGATITVNNGTAQAGTSVYISSSTTAITYSASTGSMGSEQVLAEETNLNGLTSSALVAGFSFNLIAGAAIGFPLTPLAVGSQIAFAIAATVATTTATISNYSVSAIELP